MAEKKAFVTVRISDGKEVASYATKEQAVKNLGGVEVLMRSGKPFMAVVSREDE